MGSLSITVVREAEDHLSRQVWGFALLDFDLVLESYEVEIRPSLRHKYRRVGEPFIRLKSRDTLLESEVPWPEDVVMEAREACLASITSKLRVGRWQADYKR